MTEKCPECNEKIDILPTQEPESPSPTTTSLQFSTTFNMDVTYSSTSITYKCSNPKCWVTKINESWE